MDEWLKILKELSKFYFYWCRDKEKNPERKNTQKTHSAKCLDFSVLL